MNATTRQHAFRKISSGATPAAEVRDGMIELYRAEAEDGHPISKYKIGLHDVMEQQGHVPRKMYETTPPGTGRSRSYRYGDIPDALTHGGLAFAEAGIPDEKQVGDWSSLQGWSDFRPSQLRPSYGAIQDEQDARRWAQARSGQQVARTQFLEDLRVARAEQNTAPLVMAGGLLGTIAGAVGGEIAGTEASRAMRKMVARTRGEGVAWSTVPRLGTTGLLAGATIGALGGMFLGTRPEARARKNRDQAIAAIRAEEENFIRQQANQALSLRDRSGVREEDASPGRLMRLIAMGSGAVPDPEKDLHPDERVLFTPEGELQSFRSVPLT